MALVAYDNSDASDYEEDDNENATVVTLIKKPDVAVAGPSTFIKVPKLSTEEPSDNGQSLFNLLPQPSTKKAPAIEEDDEFLHKKENIADIVKPKAKITVPSLKDFKDVDSPTPIAKPKVSNGKKSGLLSILPQPRNGFTTTTSKSFMPHVLTQRITTPNAKKKAGTPSKKLKKSKTSVTDYSDDSDGEDVQNDFFSIHKPVEVPIEDVSLDVDRKEDTPVLEGRSKLESFFKKDPVQNHLDLEPEPMDSYDNYANSEAGSSYGTGNGEVENTSNGDLVLDEEAILKLCGARGKRKREDIQIVDVNQQEVLADARQWLLKGLMDDTTKRVSASKKKGNEPTSQQKRKHQITYLAHQAKANEAELQNQWANSRMSRRQTQNKYGF